MIRGTTPTLRFVLPFEADMLDTAYITMTQDGEKVLEKTLEDCEAEENMLSLKMSQEDTLAFEDGRGVEIQVRAKMKTGEAIASQIERTTVQRILKDGVI
ncbi:MAG: hypothetical protein J6W00_15460 [Lentisphaeria bacterium]|nr:hypothetical protein [Lentisphaeria bacterium]